MKKISILLFLIILIIFSCTLAKNNINYPVTVIPEYNAGDYYKLLTDKNDEKVYNAICNLITFSSALSNTYHDASSDKNSDDYKLSVSVYDRIKKITSLSRNEMVISAGLKYIRSFINANDYEEALKITEKIKFKSFIVNYEKSSLLMDICSTGTKPDKKTVKRLLNDGSWIISRNAYQLVNLTEDEDLRAMLLIKYKKTKSEDEKLLILTAFKKGFTFKQFEEIIKNDISGSSKSKNYLLSNISNCRDKKETAAWIVNNYKSLNDKEMEKILDNYIYLNTVESVNLYADLIKNGFQPDASFYSRLIDRTDNPSDEKEFTTAVKDLSSMINGNSALKVKYSEIYAKKKKKLDTAFINEYNVNLNDYLNRFERSAVKYNIDKKFITEYKNLFNEYLTGEKLDSMSSYGSE